MRTLCRAIPFLVGVLWGKHFSTLTPQQNLAVAIVAVAIVFLTALIPQDP